MCDSILKNQLYKEDIASVASLPLPWEKLAGHPVVISGASGLVGSCLIDVLMHRNDTCGLDCHVYALGRNAEKGKERFADYWQREDFTFVSHDINQALEIAGTHTTTASSDPADGTPSTDIVDQLPVAADTTPDPLQGCYVLHLASHTHPVAYATDPIGTITTNIIGTKHMLDFATRHQATRFAFSSSNDIYGENRGDVEFFDEGYLGYIDCNTMRAGYPESKRAGEALCQAYSAQHGLDVVIPRLTRSFGPTMLMSDTKAISQFIRKGMAHEDIILKSAGTQYYSYTYVTDAVAGLLTVLLCGASREAYNIADAPGDIMLKDLATAIADYAGTRVVFELPDEVEKAGSSTATKARLDGSKLKALGWQMGYDVREGVARTLAILENGQ